MSDLFGPEAPPKEVGDEFDQWAAIVIRRTNLAVSDWWKKDAVADDRRRLQLEIARALRQAATGKAEKDPLAAADPNIERLEYALAHQFVGGLGYVTVTLPWCSKADVEAVLAALRAKNALDTTPE